MLFELLIALLSLTSGVREGWASQYESAWIMDDTVALRQEWGQLPNDLSAWRGFVATESCDPIGKTAFIRIVDLRPYPEKALRKDDDMFTWQPYLVADCSGHESTTNWMTRDNILVEFGRREAERLHIAGRGGVQIQMMVIE